MKCDNDKGISYTEEWMIWRLTHDTIQEVMPYQFELFSGYNPRTFCFEYVMVVDRFPYTVSVYLEDVLHMRKNFGKGYIHKLAIKLVKDLVRLFDEVQNSYGRNFDEEVE